MRLLGAVRLSRYRGEADPSTSPDRQEASVTAAAEAEGGRIVGWARDLDVSAIKLSPFQRPELGAWLLSERASQYDGIVWSRLDRAVRSMADLHTLAQWATTNRKILIFASGPGGTSMKLDMRAGPLDPIPHLIVTILAFAAQMEAQSITERNRETRAFMRSTGRWAGGMHPYHTLPERDGNGWRLVHNPDTAPVMREIIDRVLAGESKLSIARDLNRREIPSPRELRVMLAGKVPTAEKPGTVRIDAAGALTIAPDDGGDAIPVKRFPAHAKWAVSDGDRVAAGDRLTLPILWNAKTIKDQLVARALLGEVEFQGKAVLGADGMPVRRCEPLVSRDEWTQLQRIVSETAEPHGKTRTTNAALLLGVAFCGVCGERMYIRNQGKPYGPGKYVYYGCRSAWGYLMRQEKADRCKARSVPGPDLEGIVERVLMEYVGDLAVLREVVRAGESHRDELEAATAALTDLLERTAGKPEAVQAVYAAQIAAVEERIAHLASLPETRERVELAPTGQTYREAWAAADEQGRRRLMLESGIRVEVVRRDGGPVALGVFERPDGPDMAAVVNVNEGDVTVFLYLPGDLAARITGNSDARVTVGRQRPLIEGIAPDRVVTI
jgi:DNA invertase Pin-like site-specific DNA recombinase